MTAQRPSPFLVWFSFLHFYLSVFVQYFYNAQSQEYLYWDAASKAYIAVPGGSSMETHPGTMTAEDQAILSNPAADAPLDMKKPSSASPVTAASPATLPDSAASPAAESVSTPTAAPEKKDDDDPSKKDKDEKPRSLAAVKVRQKLV